MALLRTFLGAISCAAALAKPASLGLSVEPNGVFTVTLNGSPWLAGGEVIVDDLSAAAGTLVPGSTDLQRGHGHDALGAYDEKSVEWQDKDGHAVVVTSFRTYPADPSTIVFEQRFPSERGAVANASLSARTVFPAFVRGAAASIMGIAGSPDLDCFAYHGVFPAIEACTLSSYKESHQGGAPLVLYDSSKPQLPTTVFSPLNFPKAHHMASSPDSFVGAGVKATVETIPAGWSQTFVLSASLGVNDGLMRWGSTMLQYTGKERKDNRYVDATHGKIGFWTDNGGFYHYATGSDNATYEEVLPKVKAYHDNIGVPFGHWQFDSWFYPKDGGVDPGGGGGAVTNWTALASVFPSGMAAIQEKLGLPIIMHNRQWSPTSDYIKNLSFEWYVSAKAAVAKDPEAFFAWFFTQQEGWGLSMYEQDWMCTEYDEVSALQTNISLSELWLKGMADGAAKSGRSVQYCMPYPNDILSASAYPAVTNARATGDYFHTDHQWALGGTAMFYWALGILPFKDGFYSSTAPQLGGQTVGPELNPDREALMATLSCAMVGPMDGINLLNASRVMATCRSDGLVLKPDRPLTTAETCFLAADPGCFVYHTHADIKGLGRVLYYYNDDGSAPMAAADVGLDASAVATASLVNWYTQEVSALAVTGNQLAPGYENHTYAFVTPNLGHWVLLGELTKYVPLSSARVANVALVNGGGGLDVTVLGAPNEHTEICARDLQLQRHECKPAVFGADGGKIKVSFTAASSAP